MMSHSGNRWQSISHATGTGLQFLYMADFSKGDALQALVMQGLNTG
jgi:hypothetical protein